MRGALLLTWDCCPTRARVLCQSTLSTPTSLGASGGGKGQALTRTRSSAHLFLDHLSGTCSSLLRRLSVKVRYFSLSLTSASSSSSSASGAPAAGATPQDADWNRRPRSQSPLDAAAEEAAGGARKKRTSCERRPRRHTATVLTTASSATAETPSVVVKSRSNPKLVRNFSNQSSSNSSSSSSSSSSATPTPATPCLSEKRRCSFVAPEAAAAVHAAAAAAVADEYATLKPSNMGRRRRRQRKPPPPVVAQVSTNTDLIGVAGVDVDAADAAGAAEPSPLATIQTLGLNLTCETATATTAAEASSSSSSPPPPPPPPSLALLLADVTVVNDDAGVVDKAAAEQNTYLNWYCGAAAAANVDCTPTAEPVTPDTPTDAGGVDPLGVLYQDSWYDSYSAYATTKYQPNKGRLTEKAYPYVSSPCSSSSAAAAVVGRSTSDGGGGGGGSLGRYQDSGLCDVYYETFKKSQQPPYEPPLNDPPPPPPPPPPMHAATAAVGSLDLAPVPITVALVGALSLKLHPAFLETRLATVAAAACASDPPLEWRPILRLLAMTL